MIIGFSSELIENAVGFLALFTPMFLFVKAYNAIKYEACRTKRKLITIGLLLAMIIATYALGLEIHQAMFLGIMSLIMFSFILIADMLNKHR